MKLLTKTPVAVIIMIVSIVLSAVLGCGRSLKKERSNVENYFYNGEDGDGYSIQNDIETLCANVNNLKVIALRYTDSVPGLEEKITAMTDARRALTEVKNIGDKYAAVQEVAARVTEVYNALIPEDMNTTDRGFRASLYEDINSTLDRISHNGYNAAAQKFNDILNAFPAKQIAELIGVDEMPLYS